MGKCEGVGWGGWESVRVSMGGCGESVRVGVGDRK